MKTDRSDYATDTLAAYDKLIATIPGLERKGAKNPYTSLNGHMFSYLHPDGGLALRLPEEKLEAFFKKYKTGHPVSYGTLMKAYALVPDKLLKKMSEVQPYFKASYEYIGTLKPKPTTKKKTAR